MTHPHPTHSYRFTCPASGRLQSVAFCIYLNMRNTVCVPSCRARRMARPTIGFSACLPRRAASAPPAARRRRFEGLARCEQRAAGGRRDAVSAHASCSYKFETHARRIVQPLFSRLMFERHLETVLPLWSVERECCYTTHVAAGERQSRGAQKQRAWGEEQGATRGGGERCRRTTADGSLVL